MKYFLTFFSLFAILALLSTGGQSGVSSVVVASNTMAASSSLDEAALSEAFSSSPLIFIENVGQLDDGARFQVRGAAGTMWLASDALWLTVLEAGDGLNEHQGHAQPSPTDAISPDASLTSLPLLAETGGRRGVHLKLSFVGANTAPVIEPFDPLETKVSYFLGNDPQLWQSELPVWGGIRYKSLYPGIDLELTSQEGQLVQRLVVAEGASLEAVRLRVEGADEIELLPAQNRALGDGATVGMRLMTAIGEVDLPLLHLVDAAGNALRLPAGESQVNGDQIMAPFSALSEDDADSRGAASLAEGGITGYSTFLGGNGSDLAFTIALDADGNAHVAGTTTSTTFPATPGFFDPTYNGGNTDVFMAKLNPEGNGLVYATYLGGSGDDQSYSNNLAVDSSGNVYITGYTTSTDFPVTGGAFDEGYNGGTDAFVLKLSAQGNGFFYGTYLGGSGNELWPSLAIDASGNAYLTGSTSSSDFPTTGGAYDESYNEGDNDAFIAKLNNTGTGLGYATFMGGAGYDTGHDIELVGDEVLIVGAAGDGFPTTAGVLDSTFNGCGNYFWCDAFVARLNSAGNALVYATYLGGSGSDWLNEVTVDEQGQVFVIGVTESSDYPTSQGAFDTTFNGALDAVVSKLDANASALLFSSYVGGSDLDYGNQLVLDSDGSLVLAGGTQSLDMPITSDAIRLQLSGSQDAYLTRLSADGTSLLYATFLGGYYDDWGFGLDFSENNGIYMTGRTASPNFPTTAGAFDTSHNAGVYDAFVSKLTIGSGASATYTISGHVTLASPTGAPIEGVTVSINENLFAITNSEGNYSISNVPAGSYNLIPAKEGYLFEQPYPVASVPLNDNETIDFVGTLAPGNPSTDSDGDGLLNQTESNGWANGAGTFMTDPNDPDSDDDGLWDGQEKQFDSHPNNDKSPGIYVVYDNSFSTKEYFGWQQYGNEYIALETAIVRRGTVFSVGGAAGATIQVTASLASLTPLVPVYNAQSGKWDISIGLNNTVGKYTITLTEGDWSKSLTLAIIFELPTDLEQSQQGAYLYDDDPSNQKDDTSIWFATSETYPSQAYWNHIANGFGLPFKNDQYKRYVFDIVIDAINGTYYQEYAIQNLAGRIDLLTRFDPAYYYFTMYDVLNSYQQRNQCSNIANALTSFSRSAGIAARPVLVDWDGYVTYSGYFDTATEVWLGGEWKTTRAYNVFTGGEDGANPINGGILPPTNRQTWGTYYYPQSISDIMVVAAPAWQTLDLSQYNPVYKWDNANPNQIQSQEWVQTVHVPYWGWVSEPTRTGDPALRRSQGAEAQLSESYSEQKVDEDQDGKAEQLLIETEIEVSTEGNYILSGELYDSQNNRIMAQTLNYLTTGTETMTLPFEGHDIFRLRVDAPYQLRLKLWNHDQSSLLDQATYTTNPYLYSDFEAPAAYFTDNYSSRGSDSNENGTFDDLILTAELNVSEAGNYTIIGYLADKSDKSDNRASKTGSIVASQLQTELLTGTQSIELPFDGKELFINGINGPYEVPELLITNIQNPTPADLVTNLIDSRRNIHTTDAYDLGQFETAGANVTGEYSDSGLDLDNDGKYEQLVINVGLNVSIAEPYTMSAELHDKTGKLLGIASFTGISAFAQLQFEGLTIYNNGMDGPYQLRYLRLENAKHEIIAFIDSPHTTEPYNYEDFDSPAATLTGEFYDYGEDSNGNQLYEELVITVELTVTEAGLYLIEGWLIDQNGRSVTWATSAPTSLDVGTHTLALRFDGEAILANETSGTFTLSALRVMQSIGYTLLDERAIATTTQEYQHTAFEGNLDNTMLYLPLVIR